MTCSGTTQALEAAQEAPRCPRCDRLQVEGPCECVPVYTLADSPLSGSDRLVVLSGAGPDHTRARILAISLGGRLIPALRAYALPASRVAQFESFYAAGISARRCYRSGPGWCYKLPGQRNSVSIYKATEWLKNECP